MSAGTANFVVALFAICVCAPATPAMYRWVDENGVTVYSQAPPPYGDAVKLKKRRPPRIEDAAAARTRLESQREQAFDEGEARREAEAEQARKTDEELRRAANCAAAGANLETFQHLGPRRIRTPEGYRIALPDQQEFLKIYPNLRVTLNAANAWVGPTGKFAGALTPCGYWFIVPRGTTYFGRFLDVTPLRVCYGPLVFRVPIGVQPGRWVLEIDLTESDVRIPFALGARRRPR